MRTLEIQINKTRIFSNLIISTLVIIGAVIFCYWLYLEGTISLELIIILILAIPYLIYFYWTSLTKILHKKPGLVIDSQGILDHMNFSEIGLITWKNITHIKIKKHFFSEYLLVGLKDNEIVLNKSSGVKKTILKNYIKTYETPIVISISNLNIEKSELIKIFQNKIQSN